MLNESAFVPRGLYPHQLDAIKIAKQSTDSMLKELVRVPHTKGAPIYRGGLVAHSTGSGKTVTGLGIVMEYLKLRKKLSGLHNHVPGGAQSRMKGPYICIVTLKSNADQNGLQKYLSNLVKYYPKYAESLLSNRMHNDESSAREAKIASSFKSRVKYLTFVKFASCLGLYGNGRNIETDDDCKQMRKDWKKRGLVVILDEAHELTKADLKDWGKVKGDPVKNQYQAILRAKRFIFKHAGMGTRVRGGTISARVGQANPLLHVYALTATPGTMPGQIIDTINMVRPANMAPRTLDNWKRTKIMHHFVSVADLSSNRKLFAPVVEREVVTPIHAEHYAMILQKLGKYRKAQVKKDFTAGDEDKMPIEFRELEYLPYTEKDYLKQSKALQSYFSLTDANRLYSANGGHDVFEKISKMYFNYCKPWFDKDKTLKQRYGGAGRTIFPGKELAITMTTAKTQRRLCIAPKIMRAVHMAVTAPGKQFIYTSERF